MRADVPVRTPLPLPIGEVLDGRYKLTAVIGRGAFGTVYAADQLATGQQVAVKVLFADADASPVARLRFEKEARVLAQLRHPSTVRIFDVGALPDEKAYFVMELVSGVNLEQVFASVSASGQRLSETAAIDIALPVLGSLAEAHALGLVHRDLKPANLMLAEVADERLVVKVVDFGVVRTAGSQLTSRASALGTPRYMSPEQCRADDIDGRADLYSLACVIYEALAGRPPLLAATPLETVMLQLGTAPPPLTAYGVDVSPEMQGILARALEKDAARRFANASEMRAALQALRLGRHRHQPPTALSTWMPELQAPPVDAPRPPPSTRSALGQRHRSGSGAYRAEAEDAGMRPVSAFADTAVVAAQREEVPAGPADPTSYAQRMRVMLAAQARAQAAPTELPLIPPQQPEPAPRAVTASDALPWLRNERERATVDEGQLEAALVVPVAQPDTVERSIDRWLPDAAGSRPPSRDRTVMGVAPPSSAPHVAAVAAPPGPAEEAADPVTAPLPAVRPPTSPPPQSSQHAVRLPPMAELEAAIAAREVQLVDRARQRSDNTRIELDEKRQREAQVAPDMVARPRHPLGKGTLVGTGLKMTPKRDREDGA